MRSASRTSGDRIELLRTFVRTVDAGSLSAAADSMNTTQPTVSRRLQQLEQYFGMRMLERSPKKLAMTEAGARCYESAKRLLRQWDALAGFH